MMDFSAKVSSKSYFFIHIIIRSQCTIPAPLLRKGGGGQLLATVGWLDIFIYINPVFSL